MLLDSLIFSEFDHHINCDMVMMIANICLVLLLYKGWLGERGELVIVFLKVPFLDIRLVHIAIAFLASLLNLTILTFDLNRVNNKSYFGLL